MDEELTRADFFRIIDEEDLDADMTTKTEATQAELKQKSTKTEAELKQKGNDAKY